MGMVIYDTATGDIQQVRQGARGVHKELADLLALSRDTDPEKATEAAQAALDFQSRLDSITVSDGLALEYVEDDTKLPSTGGKRTAANTYTAPAPKELSPEEIELEGLKSKLNGGNATSGDVQRYLVLKDRL